MRPARRRASRRSALASNNGRMRPTATPRPFSARLKVAGALLIAAGIPLLLFLGYLALPVFWRGNQDLYDAVASGDVTRVQMLLNQGADPNSASRGFQFLRLRTNDRRRTFDDPPLIWAIRRQQSEIAAAISEPLSRAGATTIISQGGGTAKAPAPRSSPRTSPAS